MDGIIRFLDGIGQAIVTAFDFLVSFFQDIVWIIKTVGWAVAKIPALFSWMPSELLSIVLLIFAVVVIYKIMGREG